MSRSVDERKERKGPMFESGKTRLEVWWPEQQEYVKGTLVNNRDDGKQWRILYDNGYRDWIVLSTKIYRVLYPAGTAEAKEQEEQRLLLARVKVGTRVEIYWTPYAEWFAGTVQKIELGKANEYLIKYDTKGETWECLFEEKFRLLDDDEESVRTSSDDGSYVHGKELDMTRITAGTRIAVFFHDSDGGKFYDGTVVTGVVNTKGKMKILFDDGDKIDVNLALTDVKLLGNADSSKAEKNQKAQHEAKGKPRVDSNATVKRKRSASADGSMKRALPAKTTTANTKKQKTTSVSLPAATIAPRKRSASTRSRKKVVAPLASRANSNRDAGSPVPSEVSAVSVGKLGDSCPFCKRDVMESPRSLVCCHTFCRTCVMEQCQKSFFCPACKFPISSRPHLYNRKTLPEAFRDVACTDLSTGITNTFPSASMATRVLSLDITARLIVDACMAATKVSKVVAGYSWDFHDGKVYKVSEVKGESTASASRNLHPAGARSIERLCIKTGDVIDGYGSISDAARQLKISRSKIYDVLQAKVNSTGGFFFRYNSSSVPTGDAQIDMLEEDLTFVPNGFPRPVEMLSLATGEVLGRYDSLTQAARSTRLKINDIRRVARGQGISAGDYFFRFKGSKRLPPHFTAGAQTAEPTLVGDMVTVNTASQSSQSECMPANVSTAGVSMPTPINHLNTRIVRSMPVDGLTLKLGTPTPKTAKQLPQPKKPKVQSKPVERVCLLTDTVAATYPSSKAACDAFGLDSNSLSRVYRGARVGDFYFRYVGSNILPASGGVAGGSKPVERLCLETGTVLTKYQSLVDAGKALNISAELISQVAHGKLASVGNYFFRFYGSEMRPQPRQPSNETVGQAGVSPMKGFVFEEPLQTDQSGDSGHNFDVANSAVDMMQSGSAAVTTCPEELSDASSDLTVVLPGSSADVSLNQSRSFACVDQPVAANDLTSECDLKEPETRTESQQSVVQCAEF
ncbi:hypothetical protein MPSEU_000258400 [Mayamaea pseudoterrestris]|nr:hypothetical protein MPSEU_000258400 [Mayamaea pseudoterrestris]